MGMEGMAIRSIKRDIAELFSILPFEVPFFEKKHRYPIHYVGNPTAQEVGEFRSGYHQSFTEFCQENNLDTIVLLSLCWQEAVCRKSRIICLP